MGGTSRDVDCAGRLLLSAGALNVLLLVHESTQVCTAGATVITDSALEGGMAAGR